VWVLNQFQIGAPNTYFGVTVALLNSSYLAVGASSYSSNDGAVYIYQISRSSSLYSMYLLQVLTPSVPSEDGGFGVVISFYGGLLAVTSSALEGNVYLYSYLPSSSTWSQLQIFQGTTVNGQLGAALAFTSQHQLLVADPIAGTESAPEQALLCFHIFLCLRI
jgi:hypothetical protein